MYNVPSIVDATTQQPDGEQSTARSRDYIATDLTSTRFLQTVSKRSDKLCKYFCVFIVNLYTCGYSGWLTGCLFFESLKSVNRHVGDIFDCGPPDEIFIQFNVFEP